MKLTWCFILKCILGRDREKIEKAQKDLGVFMGIISLEQETIWCGWACS